MCVCVRVINSNRTDARHCSVVRLKKTVLLIDLTVPWEKTGRNYRNRKKSDTTHCVPTAWKRVEYAVKFLLRWVVKVFPDTQLLHFFKKTGTTGCSLKVSSNRLQTTVQNESSWIWSKARCFQHERTAHGATPCDCVTSGNGYCKRVMTSK